MLPRARRNIDLRVQCDLSSFIGGMWCLLWLVHTE